MLSGIFQAFNLLHIVANVKMWNGKLGMDNGSDGKFVYLWRNQQRRLCVPLCRRATTDGCTANADLQAALVLLCTRRQLLHPGKGTKYFDNNWIRLK